MRKYILEAFAVFFFVVIGVGTVIILGKDTNSLIISSINFGLIYIVLSFIIGDISGCHINPVISFALAIDKQISVKEFLKYIIFQLIGSLAGALFLIIIITQCATMQSSDIALGCNAYGGFSILKLSSSATLIIELLLSSILTTCVLIYVKNNKFNLSAKLIIASSIILISLIGIEVSGSIANPAKSFGSGIAFSIFLNNSNLFFEMWMFMFAPLIGDLCGIWIYRIFCVGKNKNNDFSSNIISCIKKYICIKGRASKKEYWYFFLMSTIILYIGYNFYLDWGSSQASMAFILFIITTLSYLFLLCPLICVTIRRLHDVGKSAANLLFLVIPVAGIIILLIYCAKNPNGNNKYGKQLVS